MIKIPKGHIKGALYYVSSRGDNEEEIFCQPQDYHGYVGLLKKYKAQYGFKLFSFCLLPTHLHLLIELKEGLSISDIMHDLNSNYTKYFNGKSQRKGHLFQERSKMVLLEKAPYLLKAAAYIHLNPKAKNITGEIKDYPYSSYPAYLYYSGGEGVSSAADLVGIEDEAKEALGYLGGKNYADAQAEISKEEREGLGGELGKKAILGSGEFAERVRLEAEGERLRFKGENSSRQRNFILAGSALILILTVLSLALYATAAGLRENFKKELAAKNAELSAKLADERHRLYKDLDEKYRADLVSYQAMARRLELEKDKVRGLEGAAGR